MGAGLPGRHRGLPLQGGTKDWAYCNTPLRATGVVLARRTSATNSKPLRENHHGGAYSPHIYIPPSTTAHRFLCCSGLNYLTARISAPS